MQILVTLTALNASNTCICIASVAIVSRFHSCLSVDSSGNSSTDKLDGSLISNQGIDGNQNKGILHLSSNCFYYLIIHSKSERTCNLCYSFASILHILNIGITNVSHLIF